MCASLPAAHSPQWWARPSRAPAPGRGPGAPAAALRWSGPSPRSWPARRARPGGSREPLTNRRIAIRSQIRRRECWDFPAVVTQLTDKSEILYWFTHISSYTVFSTNGSLSFLFCILTLLFSYFLFREGPKKQKGILSVSMPIVLKFLYCHVVEKIEFEAFYSFCRLSGAFYGSNNCSGNLLWSWKLFSKLPLTCSLCTCQLNFSCIL